MIAIITEKPSVGRDISRIVGAMEKHDGYMSGNGYMVTWGFGHLVSLALPEAYGFKRSSANDLPIIPNPFQLTIRQQKTAKGRAIDKGAEKQLNIIDRVFEQCESIIVATDAGREGELIFRLIYMYLGYKKPFRRLWISSLTDEAIQRGLDNLKDGREFDDLYMAADCRAKADWLIGINASQALAISSGMGNNSLGRVQTPTLAMICARFNENRNFIPTKYWQLNITLKKEDEYRQFRYTGEIKEKKKAEELYERFKKQEDARITKVERKQTFQSQPLLYDLTALQKDCNTHMDLSAEETLEIAQSLYEKKLISYPRTGSRYIPDDVFKEIPSLLQKILKMDKFIHLSKLIDPENPATKSVDNKKITDHHALIITGNEPNDITFQELQIYRMIAGRMLEAFGPKCEKETLLMEAACDNVIFSSKSQKVVSPGWRTVFNHTEDKEEDEREPDSGHAEFEEGETPKIGGLNLAQKKTMPQPLYTEATLLTAMETAGKKIEEEELREAIKNQGLGTPATRAAIIATIFNREYIKRAGKSLVPTEKASRYTML